MVRVFLAVSTSVAMLSQAAVTFATKVTFTNNCAYDINLYDNSKTDTIAQGSTTTRDLASGFSGMFRHGTGTEATCT
uniref:Rhamnogalacturonase B N-terminal domain-containing protein n=1 Tax=Globisporangium ultimum (strain ATCC 200006 / CBS 805.95 / DAOM BR144) TaxID=431595 RepID=K3WAL9_GLOUD